jgi:hypothetical protein
MANQSQNEVKIKVENVKGALPGGLDENDSHISIPNFDDINISTKTIISVTNMKIDLNSLYKYLPITEYVVVPKKRGRKKKITVLDPNLDVPPGSIIFVKFKTNWRGTIIKLKKKKSSGKYFLNSVTIEFLLENGKILNLKVSNNGKVQITGCKDKTHFVSSLRYLFHHIMYIEKYTGEKIYTIKKSINSLDTTPKAIFNVVMKNIDFKVDFSINRLMLDEYITKNTNFISLLEEDNKTTYVNVKLPLTRLYDDYLPCIQFDVEKSKGLTPYESRPDLVKESDVHFKEYSKLIDEPEKELKKADDKNKKYHTFLVFQSGAIIQSGRGPEMSEVYKKFMKMLLENKKLFEDKLDLSKLENIEDMDGFPKEVMG